MDTLQTFGLQQHVSFASRIHGQWLDLIITNYIAILLNQYLFLFCLDYQITIFDLWFKIVSEPSKQCTTF